LLRVQNASLLNDLEATRRFGIKLPKFLGCFLAFKLPQ